MGFKGDGRSKCTIEWAADNTAESSERGRAGASVVYETAEEQAGQEVTWGAQEAPVDVSAAYTGYSVSLPKVGWKRKRSWRVPMKPKYCNFRSIMPGGCRRLSPETSMPKELSYAGSWRGQCRFIRRRA